MRRLWWWVFALLFSVVPERCISAQQPFPVLAVDTAVRNRLADEWQQDNRFQHERGYCVLYLTVSKTVNDQPIVLYWVVDILRADEVRGTSTSVAMECPDEIPNQTLLHIHPPTLCPEHDDGRHCVLHDPMGQQCFASPGDMRELNKSNQPFWIIQCDQHALVPIWRTAPYPLDRLTRPDMHR